MHDEQKVDVQQYEDGLSAVVYLINCLREHRPLLHPNEDSQEF
jgi:hypothetical protein